MIWRGLFYGLLFELLALAAGIAAVAPLWRLM